MKILLVLLHLIVATSVFAQPNIEWQKSLGGAGMEKANCIQQTRNGGYIVAGLTDSSSGDVTGYHGNRWEDYWIVKLDSTGTLEWQKSLGGTNKDVANSIQQTYDGGYIVAGYSRSNDGDVSGNHGSEDYWVVKLDSLGQIEWQNSLGLPFSDEANAVQQTFDSGYIVAGTTGGKTGDV